MISEECVWGNWTEWTDCSVTCGTGQQNSTRTKTSGGDECTGEPAKTQECNTDACPEEGGTGAQMPGQVRKKRSLGIMEELTELIRRKREVRYKCNKTMTYGLMFYDIRNEQVYI